MFKNKFIIGLIIFYMFWLGVLPFIVSNTIVLLCKNYSHNSAYEIVIKNPNIRFSLLPLSVFQAQEVLIQSKNKSMSISLQNFSTKLRILPLLSGKIHINSLNIDKINLVAELTNELELDKDFFKKLEKTRVLYDAISIGEFDAQFSHRDVTTPIKYQGKGFSFQRKNRYIKLKNDSWLDIAGKVSGITSNLYLPKNNDIKKTIFDIEIANIDIAPLKTYFKHYLPEDLKELKGVVNIKASKDELFSELTNFEIIMKDSAKSIIFPKKITVKSKFNIKRNYIEFKNLDIDSPNIHAFIDGKIIDYFGKTMPTLDLNIQLDKSKVEDIISAMPSFKIEEVDVYKLKKYRLYGDALANFSIKGRLPEPDIYGDIYIDNGVLIKPIPNTTKGATVKLHLTGKYVNFDVFVPAGAKEKVWVKGTQELYNVKYADMIVKSSNFVDLKTAQNVLNPLHEILNFIIGPVPIMDINGTGNIDISVKGNRKNPHIWGKLNVYNSTLRFNDIPEMKLRNSNSVLTFNDQSVKFETINGFVNGKDFSLKGVCDLFGKFDFDILSPNQPTAKLYNTIQTSTLLSDINQMVPTLDKISGNSDLKIKIYGAVKTLNDIKFNKNVFAKGEIALKNNIFEFQNIKITKTNGNIKFDNLNTEALINAYIGNSPMDIKAKVFNNIGDIAVKIPKLNPNFVLENKLINENQYLPFVSVDAKYKGSMNKVEFGNLYLDAKFLESNPKSKIKFEQTGQVLINNNKISLKNIKGFIDNSKNTFDIGLIINDAFTRKSDTSGYIKIKTPNLDLFNDFLQSPLFPQNIQDYIKNIQFQKGVLDLNCKISNNRVLSNLSLGGISFRYLPLDLPIAIINGGLYIKNNSLKLDKINLLADNMPILADGEIKDIFDKKNFNIYFNSKPQQEFIDKYINKNQIYPIKIKGDIVYSVKARGIPKNYDLKARMNMSKDSSVYHFGATIGDIENAIEVSIDTKILNGNNHRIKEFSYDKMIDSQSGRQTRLNMLKAYGGVEILKDDLKFKDLFIKTYHPTDARIFNIIFRKPNIKQGQFTSDLKINGKLSNPRVLGDFHIFETNIPFLDTTFKNIALKFKDRIIEFNSKGDVMGSNLEFSGTLQNKLTEPYKIEKASLYTQNLDLNKIVDNLKTAEVNGLSTFNSFDNFNLSSIIANNFELKADNIQLRNIHATDFEAITSITQNGIVDVNKFKFNIAQGALTGSYKYNLKNNDLSLNLLANSISANDISWALFDLNNQIYGDMTGLVDLTCNGQDFNHCMETLSGNTEFIVDDGRMPKLGSLEYLLKAGNLVKGGITGLSINSVIDIITPLKTGDFSQIVGSVRIKDGIARNIEITSKGDDLSLFIGGTYNFATSIADMEVFGLLSRKMSTMFGPIGNLSINTLFNVIPGVDLTKDSIILEKINKIPGIELSSKAYRRFVAIIKGNINGEDYVTSFKWIN